MSPIHRISADFKELRAVEVTCAGCGAVFSIRLTENLGQNAICLGCNRRLWDGDEDQSYRRVRGLVTMLYQWKQQEDRLFKLGFSLPV
jgi:hypothetical protein